MLRDAFKYQAANNSAKQAAQDEDRASPEYTIDTNKWIIRVAFVEEAVQIVVFWVLWNCLSHRSRFLVATDLLDHAECMFPCDENFSCHTWLVMPTQHLVGVMRAHRIRWNPYRKESYKCSPQPEHFSLPPLTSSNYCLVLQLVATMYLSWPTSTQSSHERCRCQNVIGLHDKCFLRLLDNLVRHICLRPNRQWCTF